MIYENLSIHVAGGFLWCARQGLSRFCRGGRHGEAFTRAALSPPHSCVTVGQFFLCPLLGSQLQMAAQLLLFLLQPLHSLRHHSQGAKEAIC